MSIWKRYQREQDSLIRSVMPKAAAREDKDKQVPKVLRTLPSTSNNPTQRRSVYYV